MIVIHTPNWGDETIPVSIYSFKQGVYAQSILAVVVNAYKDDICTQCKYMFEKSITDDIDRFPKDTL